ncbi:MAG: RsmD family RNA methyltransferase [Chloroflexi bacterium]|nr:RsmD family RNA methyltransferase [Chloroflexota bacterium]
MSALRVISGSARGRHLRAAPDTRPTADLVKGAIFSMLEALAYKRGFEPDEEGDFAAALAWPRVLDLFAGSGALGIEALSRGAHSAEFIERDRDAARVLAGNLRTTGLDDRARIHQRPVTVALPSVRAPVDLVFADPPYADADAASTTMDALASAGLLLPTSVVVLEQPSDAQPPQRVGELGLVSSRRHGRTRISLYASGEA